MKPKYMLALVLVFVGCSFGGYWFYDFVTVEKVRLEEEQAAKEKEMASLQTQVAQLRQFADNIAKMKQEFAALNIQLQEALELMPRSFSL